MKYKFTNEVLEDHGEWLLIDISTPKFPNATMAVDSDSWASRIGGRVRAVTPGKNKYIYAECKIPNSTNLFHHQVLEKKKGFQIDHIKHGTMAFVDNRRTNLRHVTHTNNQQNKGVYSNSKSGILGVSWNAKREVWVSQIRIYGKCKFLGYFDNIDFAIGARQQAERECFGEYAYSAD